MRALEFLSQAPIFRALGDEDRARIAQVAQVSTYAKGDLLFSEGDPSQSFYVVCSGRVKVFKMTPSGRDVILQIFGAGHPVGAVAVYEERPFPASAMALEDTTCVLIPRHAFFALLVEHPSLVRGLLLALTRRLTELTNRIADLTGGRIEPRVARLFLKMVEETGRPGRGGIFVPTPLSRQEIADMTGTTAETCIRIMSRWGKEDIVRTQKDGFLIVNPKALEALSLA